MFQGPESTAGLTAVSNGRPIKFTPERLEQIQNLVERGKSSEEIAELIGSTVNSLKVTCSRLGITLRRPKPDQATPLVAPVNHQPPPAAANHENYFYVKFPHGRLVELKLPQDLLS